MPASSAQQKTPFYLPQPPCRPSPLRQPQAPLPQLQASLPQPQTPPLRPFQKCRKVNTKAAATMTPTIKISMPSSSETQTYAACSTSAEQRMLLAKVLPSTTQQSRNCTRHLSPEAPQSLTSAPGVNPMAHRRIRAAAQPSIEHTRALAPTGSCDKVHSPFMKASLSVSSLRMNMTINYF